MEGGVLTSTGSFQAQALCCTNSREIMQHPSLVCSLWQTKERARQNSSTKSLYMRAASSPRESCFPCSMPPPVRSSPPRKYPPSPCRVILIISCSHLGGGILLLNRRGSKNKHFVPVVRSYFCSFPPCGRSALQPAGTKNQAVAGKDRNLRPSHENPGADHRPSS